MKSITGNNNQWIGESYGSLTEFLSVLKGREKVNFGPRDDDDHFRERCGNSMEDEIKQIFTTTEGFQAFSKSTTKVKKNSSAIIPRTRPTLGVQGYQPVVANAVMGLPLSMVKDEKKRVNQKIVDLYYCGAYPCYVRPEEVQNFFSKVVGLIKALEDSGKRVRLTVFFTFSDEGEPWKYCCKIVLKKESEPFSLRRLLYPVSNEGMFRGFLFRWYEKLPQSRRLDGYGVAIYLQTKRERNKFCKFFGIPENFIHYGSDLDKFEL